MLSMSCKYALRALVYIMSKKAGAKRMGIKEIATAIEANVHTTAKILQLLAREELIHSAKGPTGGFYALPDVAPVYLIQVVRLIDGDAFFVACGLGLKQCSDKKPCPIHDSFKEARTSLHKQFCSITIQQLAKDIAKGNTFLKR
ncbi:MAG TPA: Rrf2 family transcriptional regulator [Chitinophagaceae bacterium]|nr:Rrf2 family transcriptional regulator [Chitinophagaceae bacterium]